MSLAAYTAGESVENLVQDCVRISNCPDLGLDPATKLPPTAGNLYNAPAYRWLLDIIRNLYLEHDWAFAIKAGTLTQVSALCLSLPDDFWRCAFTNPLYVLKQGVLRKPLLQVTRPTFFNTTTFQARPDIHTPERFYISRPDGLIYLDPPPQESYAYELHYFKLIPELTDPEFVPEFPHRNYLRQALLVRCFEDQSDSRIDGARFELTQIWKSICSSIYDFREDPMQSELPMLDPQFFRNVCFED